MPVYEYELAEGEQECEMCPGRFAALRSVHEPELEFCPGCGLPCKRLVSQVQAIKDRSFTAADAAKRGLTTFKKVAEGQWEKLDGPGVDAIVARPEDQSAIKNEKTKKFQV